MSEKKLPSELSDEELAKVSGGEGEGEVIQTTCVKKVSNISENNCQESTSGRTGNMLGLTPPDVPIIRRQ